MRMTHVEENSRVLTREMIARNAARRFFEVYHSSSCGYEYWASARHRTMFYALKSLGDNPTPDAVEAVLGKGWTLVECTHCGKDVDAAFILGAEARRFRFYVCADCLEMALATLRSHASGIGGEGNGVARGDGGASVV